MVYRTDFVSRKQRLTGVFGRRLVRTMVLGVSAMLLTVSLPGPVLAAPGDRLVVAMLPGEI